MTSPGKVHEPPSDEDEVRAFQAGDEEAFERLVDRHQHALLSLCQRLVGASEAKDLFQDVFLQAWRALAQLRAPAAFRTWLVRIAVRKGRRRAQSRRGAALDRPEELAAPATDDPLERDDDVVLLRDRLAGLPPRQREVVLLRHYQGLSFAEIAAALSIREDAARANHYQGLQRLRRALGGGTEPPP